MPRNQNLIPTQVVNKNGVLTTVHRKPATGAVTDGKLPAPVPPAGKADSRASFSETILGSGADDAQQRALETLYVFSPELKELSQRLVSTGTETGQRLVRETLANAAARLVSTYQRTGKPSSASRTDGLLAANIIQAWSYGNVREEAGIAPDEIKDADLAALRYTHSMVVVYPESPYNDIPDEDHRAMSTVVEAHWRGVSALTLCMDPETLPDEMWNHIDAFIPWAAGHKDIGAVIKVAKERDNLNPEEIQQIIDAYDEGVPSSLTDGWV